MGVVRSFLALPLPAAVRDEVDARLADQRGRCPDLRWVPADRWHLTLAFLGDVPEPVLASLQPRVERVCARNPPMRLRLEAAGRFDQRVLWLGVGGDRLRLGRLAASISAAGDRVGIPREPGRYRPHLTVARARGSVDLAAAVARLSDDAGSWFVADEVTLYASRLGASVEHTALKTWRLTGSVPTPA